MTGATKVRYLRQALRAAVDSACIARGELQWTAGYRCAYSARGGHDPAEEQRLYAKEQRLSQLCAKAEARVERLIRAYATSVCEQRVERKGKGK